MKSMQNVLPPAKYAALKRLLPWFLLAAELIWLITYYALNGKLLVNADMSSGMVLADLLNQEHSWLFSKNWYYYSELAVFSTQFIHKIALMLFSDWHVARTFSIALHLLVLLGAYFYFAHKAKLPNHGIWAAVVLCAPLSGLYSWTMLLGSLYTPFLTVCFLGYGLAISAENHFRRGNKHFLILDILLNTGIAFLSGLGGIRLVLMLYLPLAAMAYTKPLWIRDHDSTPQALGAQRKWASFFFPALTALLLASALVGFQYNEKVLSKSYTYVSYSSQTLAHFYLDEILRHFGSITAIFGFQEAIPVFTRDGIQSAYSVVWFFALVALLIACFFLWKRLAAPHRGIVIFTVVSLCSNILVDAMTGRFESRYLLIPVMFCMVTGELALRAIPEIHGVYRKFTCCVLLVGLLIAYMKPNFTMYHGDQAKGLLAASTWLDQNDYHNGYATYWNSNIITEFSNGNIEMWTLSESSYSDLFKDLVLFDCFQEKDHMREQPEGEVFVLLNAYEYGRNPAYAQDAYLVYHQDGLYIFAYPNADALKSLIV